jgi:hypothetical protein
MSDRQGEERLLPTVRQLRIVMPCRDGGEAALSEHVAFAFARDAGLRGVDVWFAAACVSLLAVHVVRRGGGEIELRVVDAPRPALEVRATDDGPALEDYSSQLREARRYASELRIGWHVSSGSAVTARFWLDADS